MRGVFKLIDYIIIGKRIKKYRVLNGLTQLELSDKIGVTDKYISSVERGHTKISLPMLANISIALNVDITVLLKNVDDSSSEYLNSEFASRLASMSPKMKELIIKIMNDIIESQE